MKKILFVINTLGQAGAETALLELLRSLNPEEYELSLYVLLGQGEMIGQIPSYVRLLNKTYDDSSVLSASGQAGLKRSVLKAMAVRGTGLRLFPYLTANLCRMLAQRQVRIDKLLWRVLSDGGDRFEEEFDLAVAYLEGGSAYYVADHVRAKKKAAFIHVDYEQAGYTRKLDKNCYLKYDKLFTVSEEVRKAFLAHYNECENRTEVFHNILNPEAIRTKADSGEGFTDAYEGIRILTVGRLAAQKAYEVSIDAMKLLKDSGENVRWYVLGEGDRRVFLEERVKALGLTEDFLMPGAVSNPYPYMKQADLYVHCSRFEGKSIAVQEAQILGKPIIVSDCSGNREQVVQGEDGLLVDFDSRSIFEGISKLLHNPELRERLGRAAYHKNEGAEKEVEKLLSLVKES